jgi:hypothetical protein
MQGERRRSALKMMRLGCANNGRGDDRLTQQSGERNLRKRNATLARNLTQAVHNSTISIFGLRVHLLSELVGLVAFGVFTLPGARQSATRQRAPGNDADAFGVAKANHLALLFPIEQFQ